MALYVDIDGVAFPITEEITLKYGLKAGQKTVMGYEIKESK